jgi:hypothetical protein
VGLELPPADTKRWSARRKAAVVLAIRNGDLSRAEAFKRYLLSEEEFVAWEAAFDKRGISGLRSAALRSYPADADKWRSGPSYEAW